jgi:hypothetical protein
MEVLISSESSFTLGTLKFLDFLGVAMNSSVLKSLRNVVLGTFLMAGCGGGEPIPVNLETAAGPCEYGQQFMSEGMMMVVKDGHLTVVPKEGEKKAMWPGMGNGEIEDGAEEPPTGCMGCH